MSRTRTKNVLIAVGFPVLLADIGLAGSGYSEWVMKHPSLLWIVGGVSGILTLMGLFLPREQEQDPPQPVVVDKNKQEIGTVAGGSASAARGSATASANQMTVNFNSVPAFLPADTPQASPETPPVGHRRAVPRLELSFVQPEVFQDHGVFRFVRPGFRPSNGHSLCILVKNSPAAQGEYAAVAHNIFTVLEFTSPTSAGRATHVGRAYWLLHEANEITISLGDTAHILIGFPEGDEWVAYHNPNEPVKGRVNFRAAAEWDGDWKEPEKRPFDWYDGATFDVDVRIVSSSSGQTLAHRQFLLVRNGIGYSAKWRK
jgi:hypothetical protein